MIFSRRALRPFTESFAFRVFITISLLLLCIQFYIIANHLPVIPNQISNRGSRPFHAPNLVSHGGSSCLPPIDEQLRDSSITKRAVCRKYSPFATTRIRVATASGHFGQQEQFYRDALQSHILYNFIHGSEMHVMCDSMIDDLWNKPAFLLNLIMQEMMKPQPERLEWILWLDRDTIVLDTCRPISNFLPHGSSQTREVGMAPEASIDPSIGPLSNQTHLLVTDDFNGLNNGVFIVRVNGWAIRLFSAILAFRHYKPDVVLKFTEQSAMEKVLKEEDFRKHTQHVPQHWFNGYPQGHPGQFKSRTNEEGLGTEHVRRGDYLVHFAGNSNKEEAIRGWLDMLETLPNIWETRSVQRDVSSEIAKFWTH